MQAPFRSKTLEELARQYADHAEEKAADGNGVQAGRGTIGYLHRLPIVGGQPEHLGKEIDRLEEQDGISLDTDEPFVYEATANARLLEWAIVESERYPQASSANRLGISERALRDIQKGRTRRPRCAAALIRLIEELTRSQDTVTRHEAIGRKKPWTLNLKQRSKCSDTSPKQRSHLKSASAA